jgi:hypothetical protein
MLILPPPPLLAGNQSVTFADSDAISGTQTTFNFTGLDFGEERADRYLIAAFYALSSTASRTVSGSPTIGGIATSSLYYQAGAFNDATSWRIAKVPTGLSGNLSITWSGDNARCSVGLFRATGLRVPLTALDTDFNTAGSTGATLSIDVVKGAFVLTNAYANVTPSISWGGGAVEAWEISGVPATTGYGGAIRPIAGSSATVSPTVAYGTTATNRMVTAISIR